MRLSFTPDPRRAAPPRRQLEPRQKAAPRKGAADIHEQDMRTRRKRIRASRRRDVPQTLCKVVRPRSLAENHRRRSRQHAGQGQDARDGHRLQRQGWPLAFAPWSRDWLSPCPQLGTGDGHRRGLHRRCLNAGNVRLTLQPGNEPRAFRQCRAALIPGAHIGLDFRRIIPGCAMQVIEQPDRRARGAS
jgi:hypothetical protein